MPKMPRPQPEKKLALCYPLATVLSIFGKDDARLPEALKQLEDFPYDTFTDTWHVIGDSPCGMSSVLLPFIQRLVPSVEECNFHEAWEDFGRRVEIALYEKIQATGVVPVVGPAR